MISRAPVIATLLYGDYPELARRVLEGVMFRGYRLYVGINEVSNATLSVLSELLCCPLAAQARRNDVFPHYVPRLECEGEGDEARLRTDMQEVLFFSAENRNILKYPMQRRMFAELELGQGVIWLDDDVVFPEKDPDRWLVQGSEALAMGNDYVGEPYRCRLQGNQLKWARSRPWWKGVEPDKTLAVPFYRGGFQCLSYRFIRTLDWPDPEIRHNGGDVMSGLAAAQFPDLRWLPLRPQKTGLTFFHKRRGVSEDPVGKNFST